MASRLTSTQEFTKEELWQPWPEYVAIFRDEPERAAPIARALFAAEDKRLIPFLRSLPWEVDVWEYSPAFYSSDFPLALLDIATNKRWYTRLTSIYHSEVNVFESSLAYEFFLSLNFVRRLILIEEGKVLRPQSNPALFLRYLGRFAALWKTLWRYREIVLDKRFVQSHCGSEMYSLVVYLLECYSVAAKQLFGVTPGSPSYAAHVAFVIWYNHDGHTERHIAYSAARIFMQIVSQATSPDRLSFVGEMVPMVIGSENSSEVLRRVLSAPDEELLSPRNLSITLSVALLMLRGSSPEKTSKEKQWETLYTLYRAFQRCQCLQVTGDVSSAETRDHCVALMHIYDKLLEADRSLIYEWLHRADEASFIQAIALAIRASCINNDLVCKRVLRSLIAALTTLATEAPSFEVPEITRRVAYLRRVLQVHWLPTYEELQVELNERQVEHTCPDSERVASDLQTMIDIWERLGRAYRLSSISRNNDSVRALTSYVSPKEKRQGCYLTECPCYGRKSAWHKTRLACKGCLAAFYCGRLCQKRDWELGHRHVCPGRKQSARE